MSHRPPRNLSAENLRFSEGSELPERSPIHRRQLMNAGFQPRAFGDCAGFLRRTRFLSLSPVRAFTPAWPITR